MTEEEKKDELKNRISMALKDPILQQGFEIICKNLADLEKENAELKEKLEHRNCLDCSNHDSNMKLLKAKKIIKNLLELELLPETKEVKQAEQFLKEIEK